MTTLNLKPTHAPVKTYYETLAQFGRARFDNEGNIRGAFEDLLKKCARQFDMIRLIGQVITVSLETVSLVRELSLLPIQ